MDFFEENNLMNPIDNYYATPYQKLLVSLCRKLTGAKGNIKLYNHWIKKLLPIKFESMSFTDDDDNRLNFRLFTYTLPEMTPYQCRITKSAYTAKISITINSTEIVLGKIPVMVGSCLCVLVRGNEQGRVVYLRDLDKLKEDLISNDNLIRMKECISDPFGYYIISSERSLITQEKERTDIPLVIFDDKTKKVLFRYTYTFVNKREIFMLKLGELNSVTVNLVNNKVDYVNVFAVFYILLYSKRRPWNWMKDNLINLVLKHSTKQQYYHLLLFIKLSMYVFEKSYGSDNDTVIQAKILESFYTNLQDVEFADIQDLYRSDFLKHLETVQEKIEQLGLFIYKYLLVITKQHTLDSRDDWGNKLYDCGAKEIEIIFELMLSEIMNNTMKRVEKNIKIFTKQKKDFNKAELFISDFGRAARIYGIFDKKFRSSFNGQWGLNKQRAEISENSQRDTPMALWSQSVKSSAPVNINSKIMKPREIHCSQRCRHCPSETPEGGKIGLIKNLSITACYSLERDEEPILELLLEENMLTDVSDSGTIYIDRNENFIVENNQRVKIVLEGSPFPKTPEGRVFSPGTPKMTRAIKRAISEAIKVLADDDRTPKKIRQYVEDKLSLDRNSLNSLKKEIKEYAVKRLEDEESSEEDEESSEEDEESSEDDGESSEEEGENVYPVVPVQKFKENDNLYILLLNGKVKLFNDKIAYVNMNRFLGRDIRRKIKMLYYDVEVWRDDIARILYIYSNSSRLVAPFLTVDNENPESNVFSTINASQYDDLDQETIESLVQNGLVEFLSPKEETADDVIVCYSPEHFRNRTENETLLYSHCNIDPLQIFSLSASVAPLANHQPGPRTSYQSGMIKQALGEYHTNYHVKMARGFKRLIRASRAFTETLTYTIPKLDIMPSGQTLNVAFYPDPDNQEDAIVLSQDCIDSGMLNYYKYVTVTFENTDNVDVLCSIEKGIRGGIDRYRYRNIQNTGKLIGLPKINTFIKEGDCIICKHNALDVNKKTSIMTGIGEEGYVDRIFRKDNLIRIKLRKKRKYTEGDKTAIRYSQKGTVGRIDDDMIRVRSGFDAGIKPDVYFNPHGFPSRQTMGLLIEGLLTKLALYEGKRYNISSFQEFDLETAKQKLAGLKASIEEEMIDTRGNLIQNKIYVVPLYEQVLKHHVLDKIQMRANKGIKDMFTHQPKGGRLLGGGMRVGEMEKDALVAHGATEVIMDRLLYNSDVFKLIVCQKCGNMLRDSGAEVGCYETKTRTFKPDDFKVDIQCNICKSKKLGYIKIPYPFKQLVHFLIYHGIHVKFKTREIETLLTGTRKEESLDLSLNEQSVTEETSDDIDDILNLGGQMKRKKEMNKKCTGSLEWVKNSCYLDSTLQALFAPDGAGFVDMMLYTDVSNIDPRDLYCESKYIARLQKELIEIRKTIKGEYAEEPDKQVQNVSQLRELFKKCPAKDRGSREQFYTGSQRDSGEFLKYLLRFFPISETAEKSFIIYGTNDMETPASQLVDNTGRINTSMQGIVVETSRRIDQRSSVIVEIPQFALKQIVQLSQFMTQLQDSGELDEPLVDLSKNEYNRMITLASVVSSPVVLFSINRLINPTGLQNDPNTEYVETRVVPEEDIRSNSKKLSLVSIVVSTRGGGHYYTYYKCDNTWYIYDDRLTPRVTTIGTFSDLIAYRNGDALVGVQYYYM